MEALPLWTLGIIFVLALFSVIKGADYLVDGSSALARSWGVSELVIGLTAISFGTSLPELVVSTQSSIRGMGQMALTNVVGSNIFNILVVLGATALVAPVTTPHHLKSDLPYTFALALTFFGIIAVSADFFVVSNLADSKASLDRRGGCVLILFFLVFLYRLYQSQKTTSAAVNSETLSDQVKYPKALTLLGLSLIILGGKFTVDSAVSIATLLQVSEATIGLTIVAIGTGLPEFVASVTAARKGHEDMAIGNVIGSNIFNLSFILGVSSLINPIHIKAYETLDVGIMALVSLLCVAALARDRTPHIGRKTGFVSIVIYGVYLTSVAFRT